MIAENIVHFARVLRGAGLAVGPDRVIAALAAVEAVGLGRRDDVHAALGAVMLDRHEQQTLFDAAFDAFWCDPALFEQMMGMASKPGEPEQPAPAPRAGRPVEMQRPPAPAGSAADDARQEVEVDTTFTFSDRERLQRADFARMTAAEFDLARRLAQEVPLPVQPVRRRRHEAARSPRRGARLDLRATLLRMARQPQTLAPAWTRAREELPALVVLLDVSGSMDRYARLLLHWLHGLTRRHLRVHTLTFGTRLTNITRSLRHRDPDLALEQAAALVQDAKGGTRIAGCLDDFNRRWARRLLGSNAALLLVTDGLDRDAHGDLGRAAAQLRRHAHRIVWLNPLLRFDGFEPRAAGVRALLPHVDRFLPMHNLASLADLGRALRMPAERPATLLHPHHDGRIRNGAAQ